MAAILIRMTKLFSFDLRLKVYWTDGMNPEPNMACLAHQIRGIKDEGSLLLIHGRNPKQPPGMYKMLGKKGRNYLSTRVGCLPSTVLTALAWASQISEPSTWPENLICYSWPRRYSWPERYQALPPAYCFGQLVLFLHTDQSHLLVFVPPIFDIFFDVLLVSLLSDL